MPHRRRWATVVTVFLCAVVFAHWILGRLSDRPLSALEVVGVAAGVAAIVGACSWARYSGQHTQVWVDDVHDRTPSTPDMDPQRPGVTQVRIDESDQGKFAVPENATHTAHRLRWCGRDEVLSAKSFLLRDPMIYCSAGPPSDDEPSCIDLSLEVWQSGRGEGDSPGLYPTYSGLRPDQRAAYLAWLSNDRSGTLDHIGYAFLFLCGLERRLLLERLDRDDIVKEAVRLRGEYGCSTAFEVHLNRFLAFALAQPGLNKPDAQFLMAAFDKPPEHCKDDDLAVALSCFYERNIALPVSWALAIGQRDPRVSRGATPSSLSEQLRSLFETRYRDQFGRGLKLSASLNDRQIRYQPVNGSIEYRDQSDDATSNWSFTIKDVVGFAHQFKAVSDLLAQTVTDQIRAAATFPTISPQPSGIISPTKPVQAPTERAAANPLISQTTGKPDSFARGEFANQSRSHMLKVPVPLRWHGKGEALSVKGYVLRDPMVYVCEGSPAAEEASCIDLTLEVGRPVREAAGALGYDPTYAKLTLNQRANYLSWLANGRAQHLFDIRYAFLFFYGLERRFLTEELDYRATVAEVVQLLENYSSFAQFDAQLNLFLAFALSRIGINSLSDDTFKRIFEHARLKWDENCLPLLKWDDSLLAVALAWFYTKNIPLPARWAIRVARKDPHFPNSLARTAQPDQLTSLFKDRYRGQFDRGIILQADRVEREMKYRPVNPTLLLEHDRQKVSFRPATIPDILGLKDQFVPVADMLSRCVDDLLSSSRTATEEPRVRARREPHAAPAPKSATSPDSSGPNGASQRFVNAGSRSEGSGRSQTVPTEDADRRTSEIRWYGLGETISAKTYPLRDPMVYVTEGSPAEDEASCIDLTLEVGRPVWEAAGALGYYPDYAKLTPNQRANYLSWLANGRAKPLADIGYAFLYFYGLERRLIIERQDMSPIVKECVRLLETYTFSGSFDGYLSRLLAFALARSGIETLKDKWFDAVFDKSRLRRDEDFLAVALAWFFQRNAPLPVSWALRMARQDPRSPRSIVLDRLPDEFNSLFTRRYHEKFGDGLALKVSKRERSIVYRPASPSLLFNPSAANPPPEPIMVPNVLGIQSQFSPLVAIWSTCIEELRPVSRILAKGIEVDSREAFEALPQELRATVEHPEKGKWDSLVTEHAREDGFALVQVSKLAELHGLDARSKLTAKQSRALAQTAAYMGLTIEPDARLTTRSYSWEEVVALLRSEDGAGLPTDSRYLGAALMLELGIYVAASDGIVEDVEVDQVARFLESQFLLAPPDARRLEALKHVFMARPPTLAGLGKRLQSTFSREQREAVGRFLTGIAAANGIIDRKELNALRSSYRALDIGVDQLNRLLEENRRASQEPIEVETGDPSAERGEEIPARSSASSTGLVLNEEILKHLMAETEKVAAMLGEAMREENFSEESQQPTISPVLDSRFAALDGRFHGILATLLTRQAWQKGEFESLARSCNLMPAGALDAVNAWAYDLFDDPIVIEQGDELGIQSHLVENIS
jgi:hypothetical protein